MLVELVLKDRVFIIGKVSEVKQRLAQHSRDYITVKQLLETLSPAKH